MHYGIPELWRDRDKVTRSQATGRRKIKLK